MKITTQDPVAIAVLCVVLGCWVAFLASFVVRERRPKAQETARESTALLGISLQFGAYLAVWLPPLRRSPLGAIVPMPVIAECVLAAMTIAIALGSVWLVDAASRRLGKQWALAARLVEGHDLITDGPYRWVRNPIYLGMLGLLVATGLALTRLSIAIVATLVFFAGTVIRIRSEERLLRQAFGAAFEGYARKVPALIPGIH